MTPLDLMSIGLWGNKVPGAAAFIYNALLATPGTTRDAGVGHGCRWHPDDIDEQGASSAIDWRSAFQEAHVVGEIVTGELWVAKFHYQVRYVVATKDRERGIRIILKKAVLPMTPQRNEPAGLHMPRHARRTISEAYGHGVHPSQDELPVVESHILLVLHEEDIHVF